jgi:hypothetical protein
MARRFLLIPGFAMMAICSGCSHTWIDAHGNRNVIGLVKLTLPAASASPPAADWIRTQTVGFALSRSEFASQLEFGYSDNTLAIVRNNSCAFIGPLPPLKGEDYASHPDSQ